MKLNEKLYNLRKNKNLSQEEAAYELNVTRQTISKWETGDSKPDFDKILPICKLYNISPDSLLNDEMAPTENVEGIEIKRKKKNSLLIGISIFLYFLSIIVLIVSEELFYNEIMGLIGFLTLSGLATSLLVYQSISRTEKKKKPLSVTEKKVKALTEIIELITLIIYLVVSLITMAWHITWIIWIIDGVIESIIKLIYLEGVEKTNE